MGQAAQSSASTALSERTRSRLADRTWRLNHLYHVENKRGEIVRFVMNDAQRQLHEDAWRLNVILKARQLGFSTLISIVMLDVCVFNSNTRCGIVDARIDDAKKKLAKIKLAYDMLPEELKDRRPLDSASAFKLEWTNGSSIEVGTSHRGGTLQFLHISELGKIAAKFPEKAREIRTGALNTIQAGQTCWIESTAEGQEGDFFEFCQRAEALRNMRRDLTDLDFKFHFFPWWQAKEYEIDPEGVIIPAEMENYFSRLAADKNIILTLAQKAWYVKKAETQQGDMKREFPATPAEAFEASVEGAIYGPQMERAELEGRIGSFPAIANAPVHTFWDIGTSKAENSNAIWFAQVVLEPGGICIRFVGYYENSGEGLPHYVGAIRELYARNKWVRGIVAPFDTPGATYDVFPHDIKVKEWGSGLTRIEQARSGGLNAIKGVEMSVADGINAMRATLAHCEFDAGPCAEGIRHLKSYRYDWNERLGTWANEPRHDQASHGADAARTLATSWQKIIPSIPNAKGAAKEEVLTMTPRGVESSYSIKDAIEAQIRAAAAKRLEDIV